MPKQDNSKTKKTIDVDEFTENYNNIARENTKTSDKKPKPQKEIDYYLFNQENASKKVKSDFFDDNITNLSILVDDILRRRRIAPNFTRKLLSVANSANSGRGSDTERERSLRYIKWLGSLPFDECVENNTDFVAIRKKMDETHLGLDKVKDEIVENLSFYEHCKESGSKIIQPVLCLVGGAGTGKTSIASSIAQALGRPFEVLSCAGKSDILYFTGASKIYAGSEPGEIIKIMARNKVNNPVILLDEIDKCGTNNSSSNSASSLQSFLLSILDASQCELYKDQYIEESYDLSKVMFICTANYIDQIPEPLLNRVTVINIPNYSKEEKEQILKKRIIPKLEKSIPKKVLNISYDKDAYKFLVEKFSFGEAGVRSLKRKMTELYQKLSFGARNNQFKDNKVLIDEALINKLFGLSALEEYRLRRSKNVIDYPGEINGLVAGEYIGSVTPMEIAFNKGKFDISVTGNAKDILNESIKVALKYIMLNKEFFGVQDFDFDNHQLWVHFPSAAIEKDGPSGGIALTTGILSAIKNVILPNDLAMTGEISQTGRVMPIGGLDRKLEACVNEGIKNVFLPADNEIDVKKLPKSITDHLNIKYFSDYKDLYKELFK